MNPASSKLDSQFADATLWREEALALRAVLLACGLGEEKKWGKPCYTHDGANIAIIQRFNDFLALMFFKGGLLDDPDGVLERQGPNSRHGFRIRFTSVNDVERLSEKVRTLVQQAIEVEKKGLTLEDPGAPDLPEELVSRFDADPELAAAFEALTPGRQRGYALHLREAKQSQTREARIDKCRGKILAGKGFNER